MMLDYKKLLPLTLFLFLLLVGCSNIPQKGSFVVGCGYDIQPNNRVLLDCVPNQLPATFTPVPTSTPQPTTIPPTAAPTAIPTATGLPTPTQLPGPTAAPTTPPSARAGFVTQMVVRNGSNAPVRVRDCGGRSDSNPYLCPQAKIQGAGANPDGSPILVDFYITPTAAYRVYRIHWPFNSANYVWVSITSDGSGLQWWAATCYGNQELLELYNAKHYGDDPLGRWFEDWKAGKAERIQPSCHYPSG